MCAIPGLTSLYSFIQHKLIQIKNVATYATIINYKMYEISVNMFAMHPFETPLLLNALSLSHNCFCHMANSCRDPLAGWRKDVPPLLTHQYL